MIRPDLKARVIAWAESRNFFGPGGATVEGQLAKLLEEASELVTDIVRGRDATDSVGDCLVVLIILERMGVDVNFCDTGHYGNAGTPFQVAALFASWVGTVAMNSKYTLWSGQLLKCAAALNIDPNTALSVALREIEPRRGSWSGGVFVKEASA